MAYHISESASRPQGLLIYPIHTLRAVSAMYQDLCGATMRARNITDTENSSCDMSAIIHSVERQLESHIIITMNRMEINLPQGSPPTVPTIRSI